MRPLFQRAPQLLLRTRQFTLQECLRQSGTNSRLQQILPPFKCVQSPILKSILLPPSRRPYSVIRQQPPPPDTPENGNQQKLQDPSSPAAENDIDVTNHSPPPGVDLNKLPSVRETKRTEMSRKFSAAMNDLQGAVFVAGRRLNELTGYSGIEQMKKAIEAQEAHVRASRAEVRAAKDAYQAAINRRSASQREVNELLQRKHAWSPADLERFTSLYRSDHANEQEEVAAQQRLAHAERVADEAQSQLTKSILTRYHEEQIWSDKIRSASTWVTWALMGFNVFLFVIVQLGLEPWRRRRLVGGFEEKVRQVIHEESFRTSTLPKQEHLTITPGEVHATSEEEEAKILEAVEAAPATVLISKEVEEPTPTLAEIEKAIDEVIPPAGEPAEEPASLRDYTLSSGDLLQEPSWGETITQKARDLFSQRVISIRKVDLTTVAIGSAAAGAFTSGVIAFLINHR